MFPVLFKIPGTAIQLHSFGLMMVIGLLCAMQLAKRLARSRGLDGELFINAGILALITGLAGARLSHVLENFSQYTNPNLSVLTNLFNAINITEGGLTYYGGFILAFPCVMFYAIKHKIPIRAGMDIVAPCLMVGLAFGRIGCFLNGCCYGAQCELPWAVQYPYGSIAYYDQMERGQVELPELLHTVDGKVVPQEQAFRNPLTQAVAKATHSLPVHPAQLYSSAMAFLLAGICLAYFTVPHVAGRGMALMMMLEGAARFALESVRSEPAVLGQHMSISMVIGLGILAVGIVLWFVMGLIARHKGEIPDSTNPQTVGLAPTN